MLNTLKVTGNFTSIYTPCTFNSNFLKKKFPIFMWFMFTHVQTISELKLNWEWIKTQLGMKLYLIKNELTIN